MGSFPKPNFEPRSYDERATQNVGEAKHRCKTRCRRLGCLLLTYLSFQEISTALFRTEVSFSRRCSLGNQSPCNRCSLHFPTRSTFQITVRDIDCSTCSVPRSIRLAVVAGAPDHHWAKSLWFREMIHIHRVIMPICVSSNVVFNASNPSFSHAFQDGAGTDRRRY